MLEDDQGGESRDFLQLFCTFFRTERVRKMYILSYFSMNFHAVKWKTLNLFAATEYLNVLCYGMRCIFLHKFEQRFSYIARACVEKYTVLENDSYIVTCCRNDKVSV